MGKFFISLLLTLVSLESAAQGPAIDPLAFKAWKDQQIVDAQNQVARVSNRLVLLKAGKIRPEDITAEFNGFEDSQTTAETAKLTSRAQKISSKDILPRLEKELSLRQKSLEFAKDLSLQDYFLGYLAQFNESPEALSTVAEQLTKEEIAELLKVLLKSNQSALESGGSDRIRATLKKLDAAAL